MGDTDAVDAVRKLCALDGVDELDAVERDAVSVAFNKAGGAETRARANARGDRGRGATARTRGESDDRSRAHEARGGRVAGDL